MSNNLFGTDGIRKKVGQPPLSLESIIQLGQAIAQWAQTKYGKKPTVLLGHDTRESCSFLKAALKSGLFLHSTTVYDAGVLPTPGVFNLIHKEAGFDFGIVISASHNPYIDNGIKIIDARSGKLGLECEREISQLFENIGMEQEQHDYTKLGCDLDWPEAKQRYIDDILSHFKNDLLVDKTVVLDCANGATCTIAPQIFKQLGAHVIPIHSFPTGININCSCGSTAPQNLQQQVLKHNADIGFAFDGDGDRVTAINRQGKIKDGDDILALLSQHSLYKNQHSVVGTIMTNQGLEIFLQKQNRQLIRTTVGDKFVAEALEQEELMLGGEQSGHIIAHDYLNIGDGIFAALRIVETIREADNWDLKTFDKYPQVMVNLPIKNKKDLNDPELANIIAASKSQLDAGRLVVRYSGTEPILRVMVEEVTHDDAYRICTGLSKSLERELTE